jgi:hypothetical protein
LALELTENFPSHPFRGIERYNSFLEWSVPNHRNATQLFFTLKTCLVSEQILS